MCLRSLCPFFSWSPQSLLLWGKWRAPARAHAHNPETKPHLVGEPPEVSHVCAGLRPAAATPGGLRFRLDALEPGSLASVNWRECRPLARWPFGARGRPPPPLSPWERAPGGTADWSQEDRPPPREKSHCGLPARPWPSARRRTSNPGHPSKPLPPRPLAQVLPPGPPAPDQAPLPVPSPPPRGPAPGACPLPHSPLRSAPAQPPQARARPAARPPPGGSIPASPGPLRSARAGSHPQATLARGRPGPPAREAAAVAATAGERPAATTGRAARGVVARRGALWDSESRRSPRACGSVGVGLQVPAGHGAGHCRAGGAPRGSLGLRVRIPERLWTTSPGRPWGGAGAWRRGAGALGSRPPRPLLLFLGSCSCAAPLPRSALPPALRPPHPLRPLCPACPSASTWVLGPPAAAALPHPAGPEPAAAPAPWRDERVAAVLQTDSARSFSLEKGGRSDTCCRLGEPCGPVFSEISQRQKDKHCNPTPVRSPPESESAVVAPGAGGGVGGAWPRGTEGRLSSGDGSDGCASVWTDLTRLNCAVLRW